MPGVSIVGLHRSGSTMGIASKLCAWLEHRRLWLWRPMREWQSLLKVLHVYAGCWTELTQSFLQARLSVAACVSLSSPVLRCLVMAPLQCDQSAARFSQVSVSIPTAFMSRFTTFRYRSCGRPVRLLPVASSPGVSITLGISGQCRCNRRLWPLKGP